jgi:hypothetical protein
LSRVRFIPATQKIFDALRTKRARSRTFPGKMDIGFPKRICTTRELVTRDRVRRRASANLRAKPQMLRAYGMIVN